MFSKCDQTFQRTFLDFTLQNNLQNLKDLSTCETQLRTEITLLDTRWKILCIQQEFSNWLGLIFAVYLSNFPGLASKLVYIYQKLSFQQSTCERIELVLFHSMLLKQSQLYNEAIALLETSFNSPIACIKEETGNLYLQFIRFSA